MNEKVKKALLVLLKDEILVSSWGISNMSIKESSIHFDVSGLIFKGSVSIKCETSYYEVLFNNSSRIRCSENDLVYSIDCAIEKTDSYIYDLEKWILAQK